MKKFLPLSRLFLLFSGFVVAQDKAKLKDIKKIYVGDLGKQEGSDLVREMIRIRLMKSDRFTLVETEEASDGILTGAAGYVGRQHG